MKTVIRVNDYLICPKCKTRFVRFDPDLKKFRCLQNNCGWIEEGKIDKEKLRGYDYLSGTFTSHNALYK
jgi:hypothetical protein